MPEDLCLAYHRLAVAGCASLGKPLCFADLQCQSLVDRLLLWMKDVVYLLDQRYQALLLSNTCCCWSYYSLVLQKKALLNELLSSGIKVLSCTNFPVVVAIVLVNYALRWAEISVVSNGIDRLTKLCFADLQCISLI